MSILLKSPSTATPEYKDETAAPPQQSGNGELFRGINYFMNFAFSFASVSVIAGISTLFNYGLETGGPVVMVWGWIICAFFTLIVAMCLVEICSVYPQAGSVYHWSGQLGGPKWGPLAAWTCGWFNLIGNAAGSASFAMGFGMVVSAAVAGGERCAVSAGESSSCNEFGLTNGETVAVAICGLTVMSTLNAIRIDKLGKYNMCAALFMMTSSVVMIVCCLSLSPNLNSAKFVFTHSNNETGFKNFGYVCLIGLLTSLFSFCGYDAGAHISGDVNVRKTEPKGILHSVIAGIVVGFIFIISLLFSMESIRGTNTSLTGNAVVQIFYDATGHKGGMALSSLLVIILFLAGTSGIPATSRIACSMVRDGAIPFSKFLRQKNQYTKERIRMAVVTYLFGCILILTELGSATAFAAVTSITTIGFQISYLIPILLRVTVARNTFVKGPVHWGSFSIPLAIIAIIWLFVTSCFLIFPTENPITGESMNYAIVMVGGLVLIMGLWWIVDARKWFIPKRLQTDSNTPDANVNVGISVQ